jgi:hypothetical protein
MSHKTGRRIPRKSQVVVQTRKLGSTRFDIISDNGLFAVQVYENDKLSATIAPFPSLDKASSALKKHMQELKLMAPGAQTRSFIRKLWVHVHGKSNQGTSGLRSCQSCLASNCGRTVCVSLMPRGFLPSTKQRRRLPET